MSTLWRNALIVTMDDSWHARPHRGDLLVVRDRVAAIGSPGGEVPRGVDVVDGTDLLLLPGMINAHSHSWEYVFKGRYENLPLDMWAALLTPGLKHRRGQSDRLIELRCMLMGAELLRGGATAVLDDVGDRPHQTIEGLDAVARGYARVGIRSACTGYTPSDYPLLDQFPFKDEVFTSEDLARSRDEVKECFPDAIQEYLRFSSQVLQGMPEMPNLFSYVVGPSAPQRCTDEALRAAAGFAAEHDLVLHMHLLETKSQALHGDERYGCSIVEHLAKLGVLNERCTLAHGVWLRDRDVDLLAHAGSTIVHNPISNLRLGSGVLTWRRLLDAGVNLALGTDGAACNDSLSMFEVMKSAATLHKVATPDFASWPTAAEVLWAATRGGARALNLEGHIGVLEVGSSADLLVVNLARTASFSPLNDVVRQLVYVENGSALDQVWVAGELVLDRGECVKFDESAALAEFRDLAGEYLAWHGRVPETEAAALLPAMKRSYDLAMAAEWPSELPTN